MPSDQTPDGGQSLRRDGIEPPGVPNPWIADEELFADESVNSADHALRNHVSRLRKILAPATVDGPRLVAQPPGYLLRVDPGELDVEDFERLAAEGREALRASARSSPSSSQIGVAPLRPRALVRTRLPVDT